MLTIHTEQPPLTPNADGFIFVAGTRVPLDTVVVSFNEGATAEEIAQQYPAISLASVYAVIAYYLNHKADVESYIQSGERHAAQVRAENEAKFEPTDVRARLLARLAGD